MGFSSENAMQINLDPFEGKNAVAELAKERLPPGNVKSALRLFVTYLERCAPAAEAVARCRQRLESC